MRESFFQPRYEAVRSPESQERELVESIKEEQKEQLQALGSEKAKLTDLLKEAKATPGSEAIIPHIQEQLGRLDVLVQDVRQNQQDVKDA